MGTQANARSRRVSCAPPAELYRAAAAAAQICKGPSRRARFGAANSARPLPQLQRKLEPGQARS
ncbi:MAG: hypothetical protein DWG76_08055 [Chloroflexi bacterium]|nr:hypothetical protein [Chloroflexota bacterium]